MHCKGHRTQISLQSGTSRSRATTFGWHMSGLMKFTIPEELHKLVACPDTLLTKQQLICSFKDVFNDSVESVPGEIRFVLDSSVSPVQCAPRNVPVALKARVKEQLDKYIRDGHITSVTEPTPWISNMVVIAKPDKVRICIDPKHLNQALQRSHYHMPTLEDILYKLPKALPNIRDAFLHCRLDNESSLMTAFWTPWGQMRWCKLPFGISVAMASQTWRGGSRNKTYDCRHTRFEVLWHWQASDNTKGRQQ